MMTDRFSLADPEQSGALMAAADWVCTLVTGTPATILATLAVAAIGVLMLQGRLPLRRGVTVVLGCFVIFGASSIADGLMQITEGESSVHQGEVIRPPDFVRGEPATPPRAPPQPQLYDPYAGASVPGS